MLMAPLGGVVTSIVQPKSEKHILSSGRRLADSDQALRISPIFKTTFDSNAK